MGFLEATRQNIRQAGILTYAAASPTQQPIPRVGYLARIHLHINGVMTVTPGTGTAVLSEKGPWTLLRRIRYAIGSGTEIWNTSGWGAHLVDYMQKLNWIPEQGDLSPAASYANEIFQCGVSSGANTWDFHMTIPIVPNERDMIGLILLQAEGTVTNLILEWQVAGGATNDFPVVLTGNATATFVGTATIYLETFTVPAELENQPPLDRIHQVIERIDPIFAVGDNVIKLLEENTYLRVIHSIEVNGLLSNAALNTMTLRYNVTDVPYSIDRQMKEYLARKDYTRDLPKGMFYWDFFNQGYPNYGGDRDLVMASGLAELESIINIASGTSLGSNNNIIRTVQQQLVQVATPQPVSG